jgi:hypothetical protein
MRLAVHEVRPDEHHGHAGSRRQQDQPGNIAVDLIGRQERPEQMGDEQPAEQRIENGLTSQFDPTVVTIPRQWFRTCPSAARSIFSSIGTIINQTSTATGRLISATVAATAGV